MIGRQTQRPVVDLKNGLVRWHGTVSDGLLDAVWDVEQLMHDHTSVLQYTVLLRDGVAGFALTTHAWDVGDEDWSLLDILIPGNPIDYAFGAPFGPSYIQSLRAMGYHEIPAGGSSENYQPPIVH